MKLRFELHFLKTAVETFGFFEGFSFWFRWEIIDPIRFWSYEVFKTKTWCSYSGWMCSEEDCKHKHYDKAPRESDYPIKEEDMCDYCGEEKATEHTPNPNNSDDPPFFWKVCNECPEAIMLQEQQSMDAHMMMKFPTENGREHAEKNFKKTSKKIKEFSKRTGKPMSSMSVSVLESGKINAQELK